MRQNRLNKMCTPQSMTARQIIHKSKFLFQRIYVALLDIISFSILQFYERSIGVFRVRLQGHYTSIIQF